MLCVITQQPSNVMFGPINSLNPKGRHFLTDIYTLESLSLSLKTPLLPSLATCPESSEAKLRSSPQVPAAELSTSRRSCESGSKVAAKVGPVFVRA